MTFSCWLRLTCIILMGLMASSINYQTIFTVSTYSGMFQGISLLLTSSSHDLLVIDSFSWGFFFSSLSRSISRTSDSYPAIPLKSVSLSTLSSPPLLLLHHCHFFSFWIWKFREPLIFSYFLFYVSVQNNFSRLLHLLIYSYCMIRVFSRALCF